MDARKCTTRRLARLSPRRQLAADSKTQTSGLSFDPKDFCFGAASPLTQAPMESGTTTAGLPLQSTNAMPAVLDAAAITLDEETVTPNATEIALDAAPIAVATDSKTLTSGFGFDTKVSDFCFGMASPLTQAPMEQPDNVLDQQYENHIRPCIDLIDSLRVLGVEKDLGLPAIAVIGDQSSGKSSVLEALSGVCLPRGSGIVTRCPLELKLKKSAKGTTWCGKISYRFQNIQLTNLAQVENEVRKAQNFMAGIGNGVSNELITLEVVSPNVPDLTLIDLPGITRVALPNQPLDIGEQIKKMIIKYIKRQETIILVVVPSNVDIVTTEALEMAKKVDPDGERTLGILTKPDLVDKGAEIQALDVARNLAYPLKKGYMMVKCRGQSEIQNNLSLEDAINNESAFFENHEHFSILLSDGCATVPALAEKLTVELVEHIHKTLPTLGKQIQTKLKETEDKLNLLGTDIPDAERERLAFLIEKIRQFAEGIGQATQGEEEVPNGDLKLFTKIRNLFHLWKLNLDCSVHQFPDKIKKDINVYEKQYRGREMTGFISFRTFENIARTQIQKFEKPALVKLNEITELVRSSFNDIAAKYFSQFPNLYRSAKVRIENLCNLQQKEAEKFIRTQFKLEENIYCQDTLYGGSLKEAREEATKEPNKPASTLFYGFSAAAQVPVQAVAQPDQLQLSVDEMSLHIHAYFKDATARLANQIPLIIQHFVLFESAQGLQAETMELIQDKENLDSLLQEKQDVSRQRKVLKGRIERLQAAQQRLMGFPN